MTRDSEATEVLVLANDQPVDELPGDIRGKLAVIDGPEKDRVIYLDEPISIIGRAEENTIILTGSNISGRHAMIYFTEGLEWRIEDLGSTNGTLLNGSKVKQYALREGDKILIGSYLMHFSVERF